MKILITGGLGFIFSHVAEFLNKEHDITVVDDLLDGSNESLIPEFESQGIRVIKANCKKLDVDLHLNGEDDFDVIIHAAAESNVDKSVSNVAPFVDNITGTINMLDIARHQKNLKRFIYVNTDEVHGSTEKYQDGSIIDPQNPYSASKAASGHFVWAYANTYGVLATEVRMCNVIGERQADTKLIPRAIKLISEGQPVPIYGDGLATREYIDIKDVANFFRTVIQSIDQDKYNTKLELITWNQELSILEVLVKISQVLQKPFKTEPANRPGHDLHYRMKMGERMGIIMKHTKMIPIQDTIKRMTNA